MSNALVLSKVRVWAHTPSVALARMFQDRYSSSDADVDVDALKISIKYLPQSS